MPVRPGKRQVAAPAAPKRGVSRLAKELKLTPEQEGEIREAFEMFVDESEDPDTIPTSSVKKAMLALGFHSSNVEFAEIIDTIDPEKEGFVMWESFARICALKMQYRDEQAETKTAYQLFTGNTDGPITIFDLRRIARQLKENVTEGQLEDMLLEASGKMTVNQYVTSWTTPNQTKPHSFQLLICNIRREFEEVMKRAGIL